MLANDINYIYILKKNYVAKNHIYGIHIVQI